MAKHVFIETECCEQDMDMIEEIKYDIEGEETISYICLKCGKFNQIVKGKLDVVELKQARERLKYV